MHLGAVGSGGSRGNTRGPGAAGGAEQAGAAGKVRASDGNNKGALLLQAAMARHCSFSQQPSVRLWGWEMVGQLQGSTQQIWPGQGLTRDVQALLMLLRPIWRGKGGGFMDRGWQRPCTHPSSPCPSMEAAGQDAELHMEQHREAAPAPLTPPARPSIWVSAVRPGFLPSDNQALISPALLSCSRSFLSQFR